MTTNLLLSAIIIIICVMIMLSQYGAATNSSLDCLSWPQTCGNLTVSYPFGLTGPRTPGACPSPFSSSFELECKPSGKLYFNSATFKSIQQSMDFDSFSKSLFNSLANLSSLNVTPTPVQVIEINNDSLIVDISDWIKVLGTPSANQQSCAYTMVFSIITLPPFPSPYLISDDNQFGSFGCSLGSISSITDLSGNSGQTTEKFSISTSCTDDGDNSLQVCGNHTCCLSSLVPGSPSRTVSYELIDNPSAGLTITTCNKTTCSSKFATLFDPKYTDFAHELYRLKLKWALPSNQTSNIKESSAYACSQRANPTIVDVVPGYLCSCDPGYVGDGYSKASGCSDLDECKDPSTNDCIQESATCHNLEGSYTCKCNSRFYVGDGRKNGSGCRFSPHVVKALVFISIATLGSALLMGAVFFSAIRRLVIQWRQWRQRTKRKYFMLNGGLRLQAYLAERGRETSRLFSIEELKAATNNFCDDMKLGVGGFGTVYKGTLANGREVAIKKAHRGGDQGDNDQFLNETAILMHINHRHIVKLLGCCLETETPLLVYEYISNGNVKENLQSNGACLMGWGQRLKVAEQIAEALAYLQVAASPAIFHRDVKSANVLLDDNFNAKVADFGLSRLVLEEGVDEHVSTTIRGTIGYLDPEYFRMLQFTHKSDVYSLGVVLVELITGLKPVDTQNHDPQFANLSLLFIDRMQEGRGEELFDPRLESLSILPSDTLSSSIMAVATLACHCLSPLGNRRPSMSRVADELHRIAQSLQGSQGDDVDESLPLLPSIDNGANTMVVPSADFYVQASSNSMGIDDEDLLLTMPR